MDNETRIKALGYKSVREFQWNKGLSTDGVIGALTATEIEDEETFKRIMPTLKGSLRWVHEREGHKGFPYWPEEESGVTLDPGVDLGQLPKARIRELYNQVWTVESTFALLDKANGLKGEKARDFLKAHPEMKDIRISRESAKKVFLHSSKPYWDAIRKRFKNLEFAPGFVQTVMISVSYNRGANNPGVSVLETAIANQQWSGVGLLLTKMQQDHKQQAIRDRRKLEGQYIIDAMKRTYA